MTYNNDILEQVYKGAIVKIHSSSVEAVGKRARGILRRAFPRELSFDDIHADLGISRFDQRIIWAREKIVADELLWKEIACLMQSVGLSTAENGFDPPVLRAVRPSSSGPHATDNLHRDVWWGASYSQVNWWLPLFDAPGDQTVAFYPSLFAVEWDNTTSEFDYGCFVRALASGKPFVGPRASRHPQEREKFSIAVKFGECLLFSAAHLHETQPNLRTTVRFSLDFRTVKTSDHFSNKGAANVDFAGIGDNTHELVNLGHIGSTSKSVLTMELAWPSSFEEERMGY